MSKLHADEFHIDPPLVKRLIATQFSRWSHLDIRPVGSLGTDHVLYRLGHDMVVRLPRTASAASHIAKEHEYLPGLALKLSCSIPKPLGRGVPCADYPWAWSVFSWLGGKNPEPGVLTQPEGLVADLALFIKELHEVDLPHAPRSNRWNLRACDAQFTRSLKQLDGIVDICVVAKIWQESIKLPIQTLGLIHGDLLPGNILVDDQRLSAVIDFGLFGRGDEAVDLLPAWTLLPKGARGIFHRALNVNDDIWQRGRAWALFIGVVALPYYKTSHPDLANVARYAIDEVVSDFMKR